MQTPSNDKTRLINIMKSGLGRTILFWFLALSIIPLSISSFISYESANNSLYTEAKKALIVTCNLRKAHIEDYFQEMFNDLRVQASDDNTKSFIKELTLRFTKSGKPLAQFVNSPDWGLLKDIYGSALKKNLLIYGDRYHDFFLIDKQGNILFTVKGEADLGTNIYQGKQSDTKFAEACKRTWATGTASFSDYEFYEPSRNIVSGFLTDILISDEGEKLGIVAIQFSVKQIDNIMRLEIEPDSTVETYLIGPDLRLRSNSVLEKEDTVLRKVIDTTQTQMFQHHVKEHIHEKENAHEHHLLVYDGPHGQKVMGTHLDITISAAKFGIIAEIEEQEAFAPITRLRHMVWFFLAATILVVLVVAALLTRKIVRPVLTLAKGAGQVAEGDLDHEITISTQNELGFLAATFNRMIINLREAKKTQEANDWLKNGEVGLNDSMRGEQKLNALGNNIMSFLCKYIKAQIGTLYIHDADGELRLTGSYAFDGNSTPPQKIRLGEGLVGQVAQDQKSLLLNEVPADYLAIRSSLGDASPLHLAVVPFFFEGQVKGVLELGTFGAFTDLQIEFLRIIRGDIAITINTAESRARTEELLKQTREQAEELEVQQEELRQTNEELEEQTTSLQKSKARLQIQQEELQTANEELEEHAQALEEQHNAVQAKNREIENARLEIEKKAHELERTNKYKSEFLANMSHELRTPLNSILILSQYLAANKGDHLSDRQVESAATIYTSGQDLLELINDILDLSKVESGTMAPQIKEIDIREITHGIEKIFKRIASEKGVNFSVELAAELPDKIRTDAQRVNQIIKNLLANAIKFTAQGGEISLKVGQPAADIQLTPEFAAPEKVIAFAVHDTGIGIPKDQQDIIFEAFQQADGSTSRKFGGTGLGLSISRAFTKLLGGKLILQSEVGQGSTFTLILPCDQTTQHQIKTNEKKPALNHDTPPPSRLPKETTEVLDDRKDLKPGDKSLLVIEDDPNFSQVLHNLAQEKGFKCLIAEDGEKGLHFADYYLPNAIILDIGLPGIDGWEVMERLKSSSRTRHIPVHFISALDKSNEAMRMGAIGYLSKPVDIDKMNEVFKRIENSVTKSVKKLLVVENNDVQRDSIITLIGNSDVKSTGAATAEEALTLLNKEAFDCLILDLGLKEMSGFELLEKIRQDEKISQIPVIIYTGRDLSKEEETKLRAYTESIIIKGARSPERLLAETTLFLHRVEANLPQDKQKMLKLIHDKEAVMADKKILLVDDDMRNVFAMTSILEEKNMRVEVARTGLEALEQLKKHPDTDLVLMDIMMPEMDGYEAMREIRKQKKFRDLPIIALTAKAMKGDRGKCIEAGASDYLAKPIDTGKLLSLLRVWLYKQPE